MCEFTRSKDNKKEIFQQYFKKQKYTVHFRIYSTRSYFWLGVNGNKSTTDQLNQTVLLSTNGKKVALN